MELAELHQIHRRHLAAARRAPGTLDYYGDCVKRLQEFMAAKALGLDAEALTRTHLMDFQLWLRERGLSAGGEHAVMRGIRATLRWAHEEELLVANPCHRLRLTQPPQTLPPAVQPEEAREALRVAGELEQPLRNRAMLLLMLDTGLRLGEVLQLRVSDVDLNKGLVTVRAETAKRKKGRTIPIGVKASKAMNLYERRERKPGRRDVPELFLTRTGAPMTKSTLEHLLERISTELKLPRANLAPHAWRRAFATQFLRHGGDVFALQTLMGHSSLEQTRIYCRYVPDDLQRQHLRASPADRL